MSWSNYYDGPLEFRPLGTPLDTWSPAHADRKGSQFSAAYSDTLTLLRAELGHIGTRTAHLQVVAGPGQVRRDGALRSEAKVEHPGVIITAETRDYGTLVYETDVFGPRWGLLLREAWKDNLRAIALGLESLRRVERYGIATRGQQYAGFRELGSGIPMGAATSLPMNEARARVEVGLESDEDFDDAFLRKTLRDVARMTHPDSATDPQPGDTEVLARTVEAVDFLRTILRSEAA